MYIIAKDRNSKELTKEQAAYYCSLRVINIFRNRMEMTTYSVRLATKSPKVDMRCLCVCLSPSTFHTFDCFLYIPSFCSRFVDDFLYIFWHLESQKDIFWKCFSRRFLITWLDNDVIENIFGVKKLRGVKFLLP